MNTKLTACGAVLVIMAGCASVEESAVYRPRLIVDKGDVEL